MKNKVLKLSLLFIVSLLFISSVFAVITHSSSDFTGVFNQTRIDGENIALSLCGLGHVDNGDGTCTGVFYPYVDGYVERATKGSNWRDIHEGASTTFDDSTPHLYVRIRDKDGAPSWNSLMRSIVLFDTSELPDDTTITSASLSLYQFAYGAGYKKWTPDLVVCDVSPAVDSIVSPVDYKNFGTTEYSKVLTLFPYIGYRDFGFTTTGIDAISKTGISKFGVRNHAHDLHDSEPMPRGFNNDMAVLFYSAEQGVGYEPKLVVRYTKAYSLSGTYESQIVDMGESVKWDNFSWSDVINPGTEIKFQIRSCDDSNCLGESFVGPGNTGNTYFTRNANLNENNRYFQYKAYLSTNDGAITPYLESVVISYSLLEEDEEEEDEEDEEVEDEDNGTGGSSSDDDDEEDDDDDDSDSKRNRRRASYEWVFQEELDEDEEKISIDDKVLVTFTDSEDVEKEEGKLYLLSLVFGIVVLGLGLIVVVKKYF